jgi:hypothetical protein
MAMEVLNGHIGHNYFSFLSKFDIRHNKDSHGGGFSLTKYFSP